MNESYD
jgi:hypothetical protein